MSRLQLALNVSNLDEAVTFYTKFFKTEPTKIRPGYANFAVADPPLKLVLFEDSHAGGTISHLGVEVPSSREVEDAASYLQAQGFTTDVEEGTTCCYAVQNKVWVGGPDASRWEIYTVIDDASGQTSLAEGQACCAASSTATSESVSCC